MPSSNDATYHFVTQERRFYGASGSTDKTVCQSHYAETV